MNTIRRGLISPLLLCAACQGSGTIGSSPDAAPTGPLQGLTSLVISPTDPQLVVKSDTAATLTFQVLGRFANGSEKDVTEHVTLVIRP